MQSVSVIDVTTVQLQLSENMYPLRSQFSKYLFKSRFTQPLTTKHAATG